MHRARNMLLAYERATSALSPQIWQPRILTSSSSYPPRRESVDSPLSRSSPNVDNDVLGKDWGYLSVPE